MFEIKISMANDAFDEPATELSRILRKIARKLEHGEDMDNYQILDINGNIVGHARMTRVKVT